MQTEVNWPAALRATDRAEQSAAVSALRLVLLNGLRIALKSRNDVSETHFEDFAQESLLRILDQLDQFQGRSKFTTWAQAIAMNTAFTELRKKRWQDVSLEALMDNGGQLADSSMIADDGGASSAAGLILRPLPTREDSELADGGKECPVRQSRRLRATAAETPSLLGSSHGKARKAPLRPCRRIARGVPTSQAQSGDHAFNVGYRVAWGAESTFGRTLHPPPAKTSPLSAPAPLPLRLSLPTPKTSRPSCLGMMSPAPRCCAATLVRRNQRRPELRRNRAVSSKSLGRELAPRFYCSLRAVKVVRASLTPPP